ncbi:MAG TPA: biopolymer transporter ExbD [Burkholderiaceae bacterium]|jgi:biopolymer transport protein ExbD|nr:biopolymer transporter ExbD [Burkholderiaceae bacterium]
MKLTPLERRSERKTRNVSLVDMNLVSLIDIFTILIFFLLSNSADVEILPSNKAVKLPESTAEKQPRESIVVTVTPNDILVQGRKVAQVADVMNLDSDLIEPLKAELDLQAGRQVIRPENEAHTKAVTIMGDKQIPYKLLRKVMVTCARANFTEVSFAVLRKSEA